jgi:hypothetical protein
MYKNATKCNETIGKWCKNKHGASKIIDTFETYQSLSSLLCLWKQTTIWPGFMWNSISTYSFMKAKTIFFSISWWCLILVGIWTPKVKFLDSSLVACRHYLFSGSVSEGEEQKRWQDEFQKNQSVFCYFSRSKGNTWQNEVILRSSVFVKKKGSNISDIRNKFTNLAPEH